MNQQPQIDIYYCKVCGLCTECLEFFRSQGLSYTAKHIDYDRETDAFVESPNRQEMFERCESEVDTVPRIFIGAYYFEGWKKLKPVIEAGEFEALVDKA